jgi:hypothetical protein
VSFWQDFTATGAIPDERLEDMETQAAMFLRSGGGLTMDDWASLNPEGRAAFLSAGGKLDAERCALTGFAGQSVDNFLAVYGSVDGGQLRAEMGLSCMADRIADRISGGLPVREAP